MTLRIVYIAAPGCVLAYGLVRLLDRDGPGPIWTAGQLVLLGGLLGLAVVIAGLRSAAPGRIATAAALACLVGLAAFGRRVVVELIAGYGAHDAAELARRAARHRDFPGLPDEVTDLLGSLGPPLFVVGLTMLLCLLVLARPARLPWWSPALTVLGFGAITANLALLPVGGLALLVALLPLTRVPGRRRSAVPLR
jgi:hypothetical protein